MKKKMSQLSQVRRALTDKLIEWAKDQHQAEIIIDCFIEFLDAAEWGEDEQLIILEQTRDYFVDGYIRDKLIYKITAIRVNSGY
jgi:hypothetical protein